VNVNSYIPSLCLIFFPASGFARYWIVKRNDCRPVALSNEALQCIGGAGLFCLLAGCFITFNLGNQSLWPATLLVAGLLYDLTLRWFFFEKEVYRICKTSKCRRDIIVERVRRRAGYGVRLFPRFEGRRMSHQPQIQTARPAAGTEQVW
jgi:O-antigen/teichoic acid export membrane protein